MIQKAIVDSNVFIGRYYSRDQYYEIARKILNEAFTDKKIGTIYVTDYVIMEVLNFLIRKNQLDNAREFLDIIVRTEGIEIGYMDQMHFYRLRKKTPEIIGHYLLQIVPCLLLQKIMMPTQYSASTKVLIKSKE